MNRRLGALHEYFEQRRLSRPRLTGDDDEALARFYAVAQAGKGLAIDRIVVKKTRIGRDTKGRPVEAKVIFVHLSYPLLAKINALIREIAKRTGPDFCAPLIITVKAHKGKPDAKIFIPLSY